MGGKFEKKRLEYENKSNRKAKKLKAQSENDVLPTQKEIQSETEFDIPHLPNIFEDSLNNLPKIKNNKSQGKQKIPIKYIDDKERRLTTFSKRKGGVIKKVHELSVLTGCDVLLIISSNPSRNVFTYASTTFQPMLNEKQNKDAILSCLEGKLSTNQLKVNKEDKLAKEDAEESHELPSLDSEDHGQQKKRNKIETPKNKKK